MIAHVSLLRVPSVKFMGEPYTGNPYVQFDEGRGGAKPLRLLYRPLRFKFSSRSA